MEIAFIICAAGAVFFGVAAYLTWAIWVHRFVEIYRAEPALFFLPWAPMMDYRKARRVTKKIGRWPAFLKWYRALAWVTLLFAAATAVTGAFWLIQKRSGSAGQGIVPNVRIVTQAVFLRELEKQPKIMNSSISTWCARRFGRSVRYRRR